jgi:hypothetical protein
VVGKKSSMEIENHPMINWERRTENHPMEIGKLI